MNPKMKWLAAGLILVGIVCLYLYWNSDSRLIGRALTRLVESMEKEAGESLILSGLKANTVAELFTDPPAIEVLDLDIPVESRAAIQSLVFEFRSMADTINLYISDKALELSADRRSARMGLTASARIRKGASEESLTREFELDWRKTDAGWLVSGARSIEDISGLLE